MGTGSSGYAMTYYPGTPSVGEAQAIAVGVGQEVAGVVLQMLRTRTAKVTGTILDSSGKPVPQAILMVGQSFGGGSMITSASGRSCGRTGPSRCRT